MDKHSDAEDARETEQDAAPEENIRQLLDDLDEQGGDRNTFNPRTGEDPGALPLTEDPLERRSKRTTM